MATRSEQQSDEQEPRDDEYPPVRQLYEHWKCGECGYRTIEPVDAVAGDRVLCRIRTDDGGWRVVEATACPRCGTEEAWLSSSARRLASDPV